MKVKKIKRLLSGGLAVVFMISLFNYKPVLAEEVNNDSEYYMSLDENNNEYKEWKSHINDNKPQETKRFSIKKSANGINNEYLDLRLFGSLYSLGTIEGNPELSTDNNQKILYGYPETATSYTTIRIDNQNYKFEPSEVMYGDNVITASAIYNNIMVSLHFSFINNQYTGREDVVEFSYTVENTDSKYHDVGVRIMFDTMLGDNDHSPFRIPGIGDTSCETDLSGADVPEYWQSFDKLSMPTVISQGTLKVDEESTPDRVRFTNWYQAKRNDWDYNRESGTKNGDSAVCLYWNPKKLSNGDKMSCKTYYGLSSLQQDATPPLAVALSGATRLEVAHSDSESDCYSPNPFTVTAYIQNIGDGLAKNVNVKLNLPDDMKVVDGEQTVKLGDLDVNSKQYQVSWKVWVEPSATDKIQPYSVTVLADNADAKTIQRNIKIPALKINGPLKLYLNRDIISDETNMLNLNFKLENSSDKTIPLKDYIVRYYYVDESPEADEIINLYYCGNNWISCGLVKATCHKIPAPCKNQANAYLEFDFSNTPIYLNSNDCLQIKSGVHTSAWHTMNTSNDFSLTNNNYNGEEGYILWAKMPVYEKESKKLVWGTEPKDTVENATPELTISCIANTIDDSAVNMNINIKNNSAVPIDLSKSMLSYYYTNDNISYQMANINYAGGRINGNWGCIGDKVSAKIDILSSKKDGADSVLKISFTSSSGTLCYNDSIDVSLQLCNYYWKKGYFDLSNDYSYRGISNDNNIANNIIFTANYLNNAGNYATYEYGEPIGAYRPTFSAFKIGEGTPSENTIDDFNEFIDGFPEAFNAIANGDYAVGENLSQEQDFIFNDKNLRSLLGSDIAYISGHGSKGGSLPIYKHGTSPKGLDGAYAEALYDQMLTTDKNIGTDYQDFALFESKELHNKNDTDTITNIYYNKKGLNPINIFSLNMKDHKDDNVKSNLQWIITAACSQISDDKVCNIPRPGGADPDKKTLEQSSTQRWVDVLCNNENLKGILGYWNIGVTADDSKSDNEVIREFLLEASSFGGSTTPSCIYDAWMNANATKLGLKTAPCGLLVKDEYDKDILEDSLISTQKVVYSQIHRYTAKCIGKIGVEREDQIVYPEAKNAIAAYYNISSDDVEELLSNDYMEIDKTTYDHDGNFVCDGIEEYLFEIKDPNPHTQQFSIKSSSNNDSSIIIRYNPNLNSVSELN